MLFFFHICDTGVPCQINYVQKLVIQQIFSIDLFWLLFALTSDAPHLLQVLWQQFLIFVIGTKHISDELFKDQWLPYLPYLEYNSAFCPYNIVMGSIWFSNSDYLPKQY